MSRVVLHRLDGIYSVRVESSDGSVGYDGEITAEQLAALRDEAARLLSEPRPVLDRAALHSHATRRTS